MTSPAGERGAGLIGTIAGFAVFLALLSFAIQLLFNLYANSAITAAAHDAAHIAAKGGIDRTDPAALAAHVEQAEAHARTVLGRYSDRVEFHWSIDDDRVRLTVVGRHPSLAVDQVVEVFDLNEVERTIEVRVERPR